ncbi:hypothetical protein GGR52DRAFT_378449 [Hypoxylon sp. FL1284]|nr:hypothetical protein GGR52DRAFT_378449 [Hypoxylon sp. FL1284]
MGGITGLYIFSSSFLPSILSYPQRLGRPTGSLIQYLVSIYRTAKGHRNRIPSRQSHSARDAVRARAIRAQTHKPTSPRANLSTGSAMPCHVMLSLPYGVRLPQALLHTGDYASSSEIFPTCRSKIAKVRVRRYHGNHSSVDIALQHFFDKVPQPPRCHIRTPFQYFVSLTLIFFSLCLPPYLPLTLSLSLLYVQRSRRQVCLIYMSCAMCDV